jgi:hypothetical protein
MAAVVSSPPGTGDSREPLLVREVNERIREVSLSFGMADRRLELICECSRTDCFDRITVAASHYEQIRSQSGQFVVAPGHGGEPEAGAGR